MSFIFVSISIFYLYFSDSISVIIDVTLFSSSIGLFYMGLFQRDLLYAIDHEAVFEICEVLRKGCLLISLYVLSSTSSYYYFFLIALITSCLLYYVPILQIKVYQQKRKLYFYQRLKAYVSELFVNGKHYFFFMVFELSMYNLPLLFFVFKDDKAGIILFSIWMRLFQIAVLPSRIFIDAMLNKNIKIYMENQLKKSKILIMKTAVLGGLLSVLCLYVLWRYKYVIFDWLSIGDIINTKYFFMAVIIWAFANSIHHTFGSFLVSCGNGFKYALYSSAVTVCVMSILGFVFLFITLTPAEFILAMGLVYLSRVYSVINPSWELLNAETREHK